jgi:hypothetical protein
MPKCANLTRVTLKWGVVRQPPDSAIPDIENDDSTPGIQSSISSRHVDMNASDVIARLPHALNYIKEILGTNLSRTVLLNAGMGFLPNPNFGEDYCSIIIKDPVKLKALSCVIDKIPESYVNILKTANGLKFFSLRLYGAYADGDFTDGHDLATANSYWIGEYRGYGTSVMIGGGFLSFDDSFALFMREDGNVAMFSKTHQNPLSEWQGLDSFIASNHAFLQKTEEEVHSALAKIRTRR